MEIRVLGPVDMVLATGVELAVPGARMRGVLAVLALEAGRPVTPQRLIDTVWGEAEIAGPNVVQVVISKLRRQLADAGESEILLTRPVGYELHVDPDAVDAVAFESLVGQAHDTDPATAVRLLTRALSLWRGIALTGVPDTDALVALRSRLEERQKVARDDLVDAHLALGEHARLVPDIELLVAEEPLRERRWGLLMRALYGSGRQADAARAYQRARHVLIDEVGVEPSAELRRLEAAILAQDDAALGVSERSPGRRPLPLGADFKRRGNLRHPIGRCIGRVREIADVGQLLHDSRLVTITGPGGVGKTRLSLEVGHTVRDSVDGGVWWVELASARSHSDVIDSVQRSLGIEDLGSGPGPDQAAAVVSAIEDHEAVLVLDNCEHLVGAVRAFVTDVLGRCGGVRVLATSREGLGLPDEVLYPLSALDDEAAVELFRGRAVTGALDGADDAVVEAICRRLDRLPLGLELAAARLRHLRADELLVRLGDRDDLLAGGHQNSQRNLRSVAQWSYELLPEPERVVFERLSLFADGATADAARAVCGAHPAVAEPVDRCLARLVDKSLVLADRSGAVTRYRLLQTLADYAGECLDRRGDREAGSRDHARWVLSITATMRFGERIDGATIARVQDEDVAVRDALNWALLHEPTLALDIAHSLTAYWFGTMRVSGGATRLSAALDAAGTADPKLRHAALAWAQLFATMARDLATADEMAAECIRFEEELQDPMRLGTLHYLLALAAGYRSGQTAEASVHAARRCFLAAQCEVGLGFADFAFGAARLIDGSLDDAAQHLRASLSIFRDYPDLLGVVLASSRLGELGWREGDLDLYADMHHTMLEAGRAGRITGVVSGATARLAHARLLQGRTDEARELAEAALSASSESFMPVVAGYTFRAAGLVNLALGHTVEGRNQLRTAAEAFAEGAGGIGLGQAALCWLDLAASHRSTGDEGRSHEAWTQATAVAQESGDPWVVGQVSAFSTPLSTPGENA